MKNKLNNKFDDFSEKLTYSIGSTKSLVFHTIFFVVIFGLRFFGVSASDILLILTTLVSLEAIYLAIFIQITVNRQGKELREVSEELEEVSEDIDEIQKDVEEIQEDVEEVSEDIDEIQKDVEEISEEEEEYEKEEKIQVDKFKQLEETLQALLNEVSKLKNPKEKPVKKKSKLKINKASKKK